MLLDHCYGSPEPAEVPGSLLAPECPRDLLLHLHHAEVLLSLVVREGDDWDLS